MPKPYLICSTTEDFFPIAGSRKAFEESMRIYELYGADDHLAASYDTGPHNLTKKQREAVYAWMRGGFAANPARFAPSPPIRSSTKTISLCTPTGQLSTSLGGKPSALSAWRISPVSDRRLGSSPINWCRP